MAKPDEFKGLQVFNEIEWVIREPKISLAVDAAFSLTKCEIASPDIYVLLVAIWKGTNLSCTSACPRTGHLVIRPNFTSGFIKFD